MKFEHINRNFLYNITISMVLGINGEIYLKIVDSGRQILWVNFTGNIQNFMLTVFTTYPYDDAI